MKRFWPLLIIISIIIFSCASKKAIVVINTSGGDGSTLEKAVIINQTEDDRGNEDEEAWIKLHYPHAIRVGSTLTFIDKVPYDIVNIRTKGVATIIYFNISKFYAKF